MASAIANADLVISRAGAGAIAELCAIGRPSILVPLPISGDHQLHNAQGLEKAGGAICLPSASATPETLAERIAELAGDPERLARMAESARGWGRPDAAERICQDLLALSGLSKASPTAGEPPAGEPPAGEPPAAVPAPVEPKPPSAAGVKSEAAPASPAGGEA
jgi:UDP-N-acetylglucosamine--N-acetylmuramyl-(pentapeptide) pyrophosphoryl-undecaprenol N-acetylglucosamine transferase